MRVDLPWSTWPGEYDQLRNFDVKATLHTYHDKACSILGIRLVKLFKYIQVLAFRLECWLLMMWFNIYA